MGPQSSALHHLPSRVWCPILFLSPIAQCLSYLLSNLSSIFLPKHLHNQFGSGRKNLVGRSNSSTSISSNLFVGWTGLSGMHPVALYMGTVVEQLKQKPVFDVKMWWRSMLAAVPWAIRARDNFQVAVVSDKGLEDFSQTGELVARGGGRTALLHFKPYVSKVPWHTGARAFLSQLFPRYGHYCGPNWSSGKDEGSCIWDKRPIDWLDYCCYCHDMGYDSLDQAKLLKADLAFLECLERPNMEIKGDARLARVYQTLCIAAWRAVAGLRKVLIPYRTQLLRRSWQALVNFEWVGSMAWRFWNWPKA